MRISDWSSDVCSSDLLDLGIQLNTLHLGAVGVDCGGDLRVRQVAACEGTRFDHRRRIDRVGDRLVEGGDAQDAATADIIFGGEIEVGRRQRKSEEQTSELKSLMRITYAVFCWKKQKTQMTLD